MFKTSKDCSFLPSLSVWWVHFEPSGLKSLVYSEHVFKNAASAVKWPRGFLKDLLVFIFDKKNSGIQICDSNVIISASLMC